MRFWNIRTSSAVAAAATMVLAAGCSSGSSGGTATTTGKLETTHITVDAFGAIDSAGLWIAQEEGLFAKQGLTVTIIPGTSTQTLVNNQLSGKADISTGDYVTYIQDELQGTPLRIIAEASFLQPNVLTLLVPPGSKVTSINALKGKTISVNAPNDIGTLLVDSLLTEHGIPRRDVNINSNVAFPNVAKAFQTGATNVAFAPEPFVSLFAQGGGVQELTDLDQGATSNFPIQGYAVTQQWATAHPNTLKAFLTALRQGQQVADTNRGAVETAIEKNLGLTPAQAALVSLPNFPVSLDPTRLQRVVNDLKQFNLFSALPQVNQKLQTFQIGRMIING
jgi:NitT/TauT family transport system substrate-binding protein